jgi:predicted RNA-binding Zn ribbon-like protein
MNFDWNAHRFSGGVLALDLANTVIFRETPERLQDRFADAAEVPRFAMAAAHFRQGEWGDVQFRPPVTPSGFTTLINARESINGLFRAAAKGQGLAPRTLSAFLRLGSDIVCHEPDNQKLALPQASGMRSELSLTTAAFLSGISLFEPSRLERVKICPNCHWLYFDESRNRSRRWCDMRVCGNRAKARRHYDRNGRLAENGSA